MITLAEACKIAKRELESENSFVWDVCTDMGDSWVFTIGWKNSEFPGNLSGFCYIISKEDGTAKDSVIQLMDKDFYDKWLDAPEIDISEYL